MQMLLTLSFDGTAYHGFQVQKNALSVCEVLQNGMQQLYGMRPPVKGCSRTDAGVHALGYCVSYAPPKDIPPQKLPLSPNRFLPDDIRVLAAVPVADDFHARYSAVSKEYVYKIWNSPVDDPFTSGYHWRVSQPLNEEAMAQAAAFAVGTHDFRAFMSTGSKIKDTVRTVHFFRVQREDKQIMMHICANGYLYNMVRILVGTLVEAGAGRMPPEGMRAALESGQRSMAGDTAPAKGLFLYRVNYENQNK